MLIGLELITLLLCILIGARLGGISLGTVSGIGLLIFIFVFRMPPGGPPGNVLGMIIAVITAVSAMQAAGGLDFLVDVATRFMRRRPRQVTILAPAFTYLLVFAAGTQHVLYALLPVIAEVSRQAGTTRIGKFLLDHSFMRPGLVATASATFVATVLARLLL